ncbi:MAG TPA: NAD-dependent epimerase/dehydratase family protein [Rhizomicrobium sp.]|nr:NAD-dependent epimerase/dehydratase family protein [Rhizomicrobium sp.]
MALHLVTGGSGFVGSNIARRLLDRGEQVRVLDIWKSADLPDLVEFIQADINDSASVAAAMKGVDFVHHNVALVPLHKAGRGYWKVNVEGTQIALTCAKAAGVKMFSHMSSSAVFGLPTVMPITNDTRREPIEIYGHAKKAGEDLVLRAMEEGFPACIIRPRTIIGTGRLGIFQILFEWIKDGANVYTIGEGNGLFQFVHCDDLADTSIIACVDHKPGVYNVGTDRFGTLREDLEFLCAHAKTGSRVKSLPAGLAIGTLTMLDKLRLSPLGPWHYLTYHKPFYFDSEPVYRALNWRPKYGNREMMCSSYDWFIRHAPSANASKGSSAHKSPVRQGVLKILKAIS